MGGSGSGYFKSNADTIKQKLRDSESSTGDAAYEANVGKLLSDMLAQFNDRNYEAINQHLAEIKGALGKEIDGDVEILFGGSVAKHTYVDGLSDVDSLVILNNTELATLSPEDAKEYFAERLGERFPKTDIRVGHLAVTMNFGDAQIQLLPVIKGDGHLKIADSSGGGWSRIKPEEFSKALSHLNGRLGNKVVPVIKLAKAIIYNLPKKHQISGYHAESLAVEVFKTYTGSLSIKAMLKHFFSCGAECVKSPIKDSTGQSRHVDDYLGGAGSLERRIVSDAFGRVSRRILNADNSTSVEVWNDLFGD